MTINSQQPSNMNDEPSGQRRSSTLISRNVTILNRRTSIRLESEMWLALRDIAKIEGCTLHDICSLVSLRKRKDTSLTAAIRVFLMLYYKAAATEEGHRRAGHGDFKNMQARAKIVVDKTMIEEEKIRYFDDGNSQDIAARA